MPPIRDEGVVQSGNHFRTEHRLKRCQIIDGIPRTVRADRIEEVPEMIEARVDPFVTRRLERSELARVGAESISEFTPRLFAFGPFHCAAPLISTHLALKRELPLGSRSGPRPGLYGLGDLWSGSADHRKAWQLIRARAALTPQPQRRTRRDLALVHGRATLSVLQQPIEVIQLQLQREAKYPERPKIGDRVAQNLRSHEPIHSLPQGCAPALWGCLEQ
jgi:hypothetical protein